MSQHPRQQQYWGRQAVDVTVPPVPPPAPAPPLSTHPSLSAHPSYPIRQPPRHSIFSSLPPVGQPMQLNTTQREKDLYQDMSALFSLITATERLENMWARRGSISQEDYERQCEKLIQQFSVLRTATQQTIPNIDLFIAEYGIKASLARPRLRLGVPATVYIKGAGKDKDQAKFVLRCTTLFHYVGNCIDMHQRTVGLLLPDLISLMKTLNRIPALGQDFEFGQTIRLWVEKLNAMPAADQLSEQDASQLKLDLDKGFAEFESAYND